MQACTAHAKKTCRPHYSFSARFVCGPCMTTPHNTARGQWCASSRHARWRTWRRSPWPSTRARRRARPPGQTGSSEGPRKASESLRWNDSAGFPGNGRLGNQRTTASVASSSSPPATPAATPSAPPATTRTACTWSASMPARRGAREGRRGARACVTRRCTRRTPTAPAGSACRGVAESAGCPPRCERECGGCGDGRVSSYMYLR